MSADLKLPDGTLAIFTGTRWLCADPRAKVVAQYFAKSLPPDNYPDKIAAVVEHVAAQIVGASVARIDLVHKPDLEPEEETDWEALSKPTRPCWDFEETIRRRMTDEDRPPKG